MEKLIKVDDGIKLLKAEYITIQDYIPLLNLCIEFLPESKSLAQLFLSLIPEEIDEETKNNNTLNEQEQNLLNSLHYLFNKSEITDFNGPLLTRLNAVIYEKQSQYQQLVRQCDFQIKYSKKETTSITKLNSLLNEF